MRALLLLLLVPCAACAQDVAWLFGKPVTAAELDWGTRFIAAAGHEATRPPPGTRAHAWWIEGYKPKKALYEKYGELRIADAMLAKEFWDALARGPRFPARPEQIDFTYYWLKPPTTK